MPNLTKLERQWISQTFDDGTGYLDNSGVDMPPEIERGIIASLIKKGVIEADHDPQRARDFGIYTDLFAMPEYAEWFV